MGKNETQICKQFWAKADYLPLEAIVDYWCGEKNPQECRKAKTYAIITACDNNEILFERTVPWKAPVLELAEKGQLLIKRQSFETWAQQFEDGDDAIPKPLSTTREQTLLKIIGALIRIHYNKPAYRIGDRLNASVIGRSILGKLKTNEGLKDIRKAIPDAILAIEENFDGDPVFWVEVDSTNS